MSSNDFPNLLRVTADAEHPNWCPTCRSNKWEWIAAVPITPEELERYLLLRYRCRKCHTEFLVEETKRSRFVTSIEKCTHCGSSRSLRKTSKPGADIEIWQCSHCKGYMAVKPPDWVDPSDRQGPVSA